MPSRAEAARRYLALARAVTRARRAAFDPFKLTWIVTEECSLRCGPCHLWATAPRPGPDLGTFERVLDANPQLTWLNLSGGDLVEREDAPALFERVARRSRDLALLDFPTAGQDEGATLAAVEPLLDSDIPRIYVTVSIDGPDRAHDRVRGRRGAAECARRTYRRLRSIRRRGFSAVVGMTLSRFNLPERLDGPPERWLPQDIPLQDLHLNLAHGSDHYYRSGKDVAPPVAAALQLLDAVRRRRGPGWSPLAVMERRYWRVAKRYLDGGGTGVACGALRASVFLGADLRIYPCSIFDRPLGNLADIGYDLRRIPELPDARTVLGLVEADRCPHCWSPCEAFPTLLLRMGAHR